MLHEYAVLHHCQLGVISPLADHEFAVHGLTAGQELGLGQDGGAAPAGSPVLLAPLPLRLHPGGPLDAGHLIIGATLGLGVS